MSNKTSKQKFHFYAVSGNVIWRNEDDTEVQSINANGLVQLDTRYVTQHGLAIAQQCLMKTANKKVGADPAKMVDVIMVSLNYLGEMTEEQFYAVPEGIVRREIEAAEQEGSKAKLDS